MHRLIEKMVADFEWKYIREVQITSHWVTSKDCDFTITILYNTPHQVVNDNLVYFDHTCVINIAIHQMKSGKWNYQGVPLTFTQVFFNEIYEVVQWLESLEDYNFKETDKLSDTYQIFYQKDFVSNDTPDNLTS